MAIECGQPAQIWRQPRTQREHPTRNAVVSVYLQTCWVKIVRILLVVLLVASSAMVERHQTLGVGQQGVTKQPFSITTTAVKTEVPAGSPVEILIRQTNTSNQDVNWSAIYYDGVSTDYTFDIRLEGGKKLKPLHRRDGGPIVGSAMMGTLKPGESRETRVNIASQYDMTRAGKYTVQLSKPVSADPKKAEVKSNTITIAVTK